MGNSFQDYRIRKRRTSGRHASISAPHLPRFDDHVGQSDCRRTDSPREELAAEQRFRGLEDAEGSLAADEAETRHVYNFLMNKIYKKHGQAAKDSLYHPDLDSHRMFFHLSNKKLVLFSPSFWSKSVSSTIR